MKALEPYVQLIEEGLEKIDLPKTPENLYQPIEYFIQIGGKRIRPVLTLMAAELFGTEKESALPAALAIELFHNFSLIHDDIMDHAPLRRGKQTVHEKWNSNIAILSGDVLFVIAYQELSKQSSEHLFDLLNLFNKTAIEVCEGQQMDMDFELLPTVTVEAYIEMIRLKTSVLLGCALQFGAIIAGASKKNQALIYEFGINLGIAFQIQDDLLDLYGEPTSVGKQVGGDIIANKKTLLCILAETHADQKNALLLDEMFNEKDPILKISKAKNLFKELDIFNKCNAEKERYMKLAIDALAAIESPTKKDLFFEISNFLLNRDA